MGRSRGGLTTKIHALVDALGRPIRLKLTAGQALLADRAYDSDALHETLAARGAFANIRLMSNRVKVFDFNAELCKARNLVERVCLFSRTRGVHRLTQQTQTLPRHRNPIR